MSDEQENKKQGLLELKVLEGEGISAPLPEIREEEMQYILPMGNPIIFEYSSDEALLNLIREKGPSACYARGEPIDSGSKKLIPIQFYKIPGILTYRAIMRKFSAWGFP